MSSTATTPSTCRFSQLTNARLATDYNRAPCVDEQPFELQVLGSVPVFDTIGLTPPVIAALFGVLIKR